MEKAKLKAFQRLIVKEFIALEKQLGSKVKHDLLKVLQEQDSSPKNIWDLSEQSWLEEIAGQNS
jgi:hypothetical protein